MRLQGVTNLWDLETYPFAIQFNTLLPTSTASKVDKKHKILSDN